MNSMGIMETEASGSVIEDALLGLSMVSGNLLIAKEKYTVLRKDHALIQNVKLISGGVFNRRSDLGGYVSPGMLTAVVFGDFNEAPSVTNILYALMVLGNNHSAGIIVVVGDSLKERLNFGLAVEHAREKSLRVKTLRVCEDVVNEEMIEYGDARMVILYKIAGAMAEKGFSLDDIHDYCSALCKYNLETLRLSTPVKITLCDEMILKTLDKILFTNNKTSFHLKENDSVVLVINNSGLYSKLQEYLYISKIVKQLKYRGINVVRAYSGTFNVAVSASEFSLTVLKIADRDILKFLHAPTAAPGWPRTPCFGCEHNSVEYISEKMHAEDDSAYEVPNNKLGPRLSRKSEKALNEALNGVMDAVIACSRQLDMFDDSKHDCGTRLKVVAEAVKTKLSERTIDVAHPSLILMCLAALSEQHVQRIMGSFYFLFFSAAAKVFQDADDAVISYRIWESAFNAGVKAIRIYTTGNHSTQSMVVSLQCAADAFHNAVSADPTDPVAALSKAAEAAEDSALPHISEEDPDPGAHAVGIWMRALYESVRLRF